MFNQSVSFATVCFVCYNMGMNKMARCSQNMGTTWEQMWEQFYPLPQGIYFTFLLLFPLFPPNYNIFLKKLNFRIYSIDRGVPWEQLQIVF